MVRKKNNKYNIKWTKKETGQGSKKNKTKRKPIRIKRIKLKQTGRRGRGVFKMIDNSKVTINATYKID